MAGDGGERRLENHLPLLLPPYFSALKILALASCSLLSAQPFTIYDLGGARFLASPTPWYFLGSVFISS